MYFNVLKILKDYVFCLYQFDIHFALLSFVVIAATSWLQWICKIDIPHRFAGGVACDAAVAAHASMLGSGNHPCRRPDIRRPRRIANNPLTPCYSYGSARVARVARIRDARHAGWQ